MSRSGYSDDYDFLNLYRANVDRTIASKKGQAFLRDLIAALDAIPSKRLIAHELKSEDGEVCALGSIGVVRGIDMEPLDPEDGDQIGRVFGISSTLAREVVYMNDEYTYSSEEPEQRWQRMRDWATENLTTSTQ